MPDKPLVLGINRTQDASVCLMRGSELLWAIQKERLTRRKHHWGRVGDLSEVYVPRLPGLDQPVDVLVECYSSDAEFDRLDAYERELGQSIRLAPGARRARISHHLAHLYSAFHPSPFESAAVMIVDGQGSAVRDFTERWEGQARPDWLEVASYYVATRSGIACVAKQVWDRDESNPVGLGMFYFLLTHAIFPGEGNEGKVMGLAPHGDPEALAMPPLEVDGHCVYIPQAWRRLLGEKARFRDPMDHPERFLDAANLAAAGQRAFEEALWEVARWLHARTGLDQLCFAGGTALNCPGNEGLHRRTPFREVFVTPAPSDAGTALGCAVCGLVELAGQPCGFRWTDDYLGPPVLPAAVAAALADAARLDKALDIERIDDMQAFAGRVASLLAARQVVALYQGRSEFGPRALGHRSILADPREEGMRDWINTHVKQREWFRPLAPVVLAERARDYFALSHPSPYMQWAVPSTPLARERAPAVVHVDGTGRVQTVDARGDPLLRAIIERFDALTGVPVVLNTSLNRKEEPIVETPQEALATFRATPMHALAMPPFLAIKRQAPA
jgi:carbamoyltransferase